MIIVIIYKYQLSIRRDVGESNLKHQAANQKVSLDQIRLISQLQQLQESKQQLSKQEYDELKASTLEDLQTFQAFLSSMQKGDKILDSQIQKQKELIMKTCRQTFNKEQLTKTLLTAQVKQIRNKIKDVQKDYHMKKINEEAFIMTKRKYIMEIQQTGLKLQPAEEEWFQVNDFDKNQGIKTQIAAKHMETANKNIQSLK